MISRIGVSVFVKRLIRQYPNIVCMDYFRAEGRQHVIKCAISTRDLAKNMVKVKSSNVWAYAINIKDRKDKVGDVLVQFKGKNGGPYDIYIYYDVPITVYRRWHTAPSVGHYFWQYIRNNYKYSKLTGNKRGILPNAVNH